MSTSNRKLSVGSVLLGSVLFFFAVILDDMPVNTNDYWSLIFGLFSFEFGLVYFCRYFITLHATRKIHRGIWGYKTLIIGSGKKSQQLYKDLVSAKQKLGYNVVGHIETGFEKNIVKSVNPIGTLDNLERIIADNDIEQLIVAPEIGRASCRARVYVLV